jgi:Tfp pilus assembly protein PilV
MRLIKSESTRMRTSHLPKGISIIEVMIAAVIMLAVALGVIPLFVRSITSNATGQEYTSVSNHARAHAEEMFQLPWDAPDLTIPGGQTELVTDDYFSKNNQRWEVGITPADPTDRARWSRTTTVKQYSINALQEDPVDKALQLDVAQALDGAADPGIVQLKEIQVSVTSDPTTGPLGNKGRLTVWMLKTH